MFLKVDCSRASNEARGTRALHGRYVLALSKHATRVLHAWCELLSYGSIIRDDQSVHQQRRWVDDYLAPVRDTQAEFS